MPPLELVNYQLESTFWKELGVGQGELDRWPQEKINRYVAIVGEIATYQEKLAEMEAQKAAARSR